MAEDVMLQEAIEAIRQGQRNRARDLLTRLLRANQNNPEYWIWMSSVVDTQKEQVYCLQSVLRLDPQNHTARQGLIVLGALPPEGAITPVPPVRRNWEVEAQAIPKRRLWDNPAVRIGAIALMTFIVVGLVFAGIFSAREKDTGPVAFIPTKTPGPSPTFTYTPTPINFTPTPPTATPTLNPGPPPLWTLLDATYTPTPVYINTPRVSNEAFGIAQRALASGDLSKALQYFEQASQISPDAADIQYLIGEIHRQQKDYQAALEAYDLAIEIDPNFAPAYLGRGRARLGIRSRTNVLADYQAAVEKDPNFIEAQLVLAAYLLEQNKPQEALKQLKITEKLAPDNPLVYFYQAQIYLQDKENELALENIRKANQADLTLLPAYRLLGQAALVNKEYAEALEALDLYLTYEPEDASALYYKGQVLYATQEYSPSIQALTQALRLNRSLPIYRYRGIAYLELGMGQEAINDLSIAMQGNQDSFELNMAMGRSLLLINRLQDVLPYFLRCERLAKADEEKAQAYYWLAQLYESVGNIPTAIEKWKLLLALPKDAVPAEWLAMAKQHVAVTATLAPSPTPTPTAKKSSPTPTGKASATSVPQATPTPTPLPKPGTITPTSKPGAATSPTPTPSGSPASETPGNKPSGTPTPKPGTLTPTPKPT